MFKEYNKQEDEIRLKDLLDIYSKEEYKEIIEILNRDQKRYHQEQLILSGVVNCVYVVTERDNYGEQLFRGVFAKKEKAIEFLAKQGLKTGNIDEINEIELA